MFQWFVILFKETKSVRVEQVRKKSQYKGALLSAYHYKQYYYSEGSVLLMESSEYASVLSTHDMKESNIYPLTLIPWLVVVPRVLNPRMNAYRLTE